MSDEHKTADTSGQALAGARGTNPPGGIHEACYFDIAAAVKAPNGALRLYRRRRWWPFMLKQDIYHPPGEWAAVDWTWHGVCVVRLAEREPS